MLARVSPRFLADSRNIKNEKGITDNTDSIAELELSRRMSHGEESQTTEFAELVKRNAVSPQISRENFSKRIDNILFESKSRNSRTPQKLIINKQRYESDAGYIGRGREMDCLQSCLDRLTSPQERKRKELVLIKGHCGVGKSSLVHILEETIASSTDALFAMGGFDLDNSGEPYSAVSVAIGEIFQSIFAKREAAEVMEIGESISSQLGYNVAELTRLIPELEWLVPNAKRQREIETYNVNARKDRWKYSFRTLIRIISSYFSSVVLAFDDMQWADQSSLEVIDFLLSDTQNQNALMIVGCFRSDEVDESHILLRKINDLAVRKEKLLFHITDIAMENFELSEVKRFVTIMLSIENEDGVQDLAEICFKRTLGNPFFLIEFLGMLEFDGGLRKWGWYVSTIEDATMFTTDVIGLLHNKMTKMPQDVQLVLRYAACLGSSFSLSTIKLMWTKHAGKKAGGIEHSLSLLEKANLIEHHIMHKVSVYKWVHDKVQEAALSFSDAGKASFQFEVGLVLYNSLNGKELKEALFPIVNLINKGRTIRRQEFAELNLMAAEKAMDISALRNAATYAAKGIELLPSDKWLAHRNLTLRLFALGAETELSLGRSEVIDEYIDAVLSRNDCTVLEKLPLYKTQIHKLSVELRYEESIELCLEILRKMGLTLIQAHKIIPKQAMSSLSNTIQKIKKVPDDFFEKPKVMTNPLEKAKMFFLHWIKYASFRLQNQSLAILSTTQMVQLTMERGICDFSGPAYADLAVLTFTELGNVGISTTLGETALLIEKAVDCGYTEAMAVFLSYFSVLPWTIPLQSCIDPLSRAFTSGLLCGNTEYAMWNGIFALTIHYPMGKPLQTQELSSFLTQCDEFMIEEVALYTRMFWQMMLNLMGKSKHTVLLKGGIFDSQDFLPKTSRQDVFAKFIENQLLSWFGEYEELAEWAISERNEHYEKSFPCSFWAMLETFHSGVALYSMARQTNKKKYKKNANRIRRTIDDWIQKGNPNVKHYQCLLNAEQAVLDEDYEAAQTLYRDAIALAARTGYLQDAGLANERYADFLFKELSNEYEANHHIQEAIKFYKEWGAEAKAQFLAESWHKSLVSHLRKDNKTYP